jgi:putative transposase
MYYRRHLPHWQPANAALFITWRLFGSQPANPPLLSNTPPPQPSVATGPRWLTDDRIAQCVLDTLRYGEAQLNLYTLQAWVLIVNHVHILIQPAEGITLPSITKSIKNYSARRANEILGRMGYPFWQEESYDHWIRDRHEFEKVVRYIEENPVTAGLVSRPQDWRWSSATQ